MNVALFAASRPHYRTALALARLADVHTAWTSLLFDALAPQARYGLGLPPERTRYCPLSPVPDEVALSVLLREQQADALLVFGGAAPALAAGKAALRAGIALIHMEAGQRPDDMSLQAAHRELDALALLRCCLSRRQALTLENEGLLEGVCVVGDPLYDLFQEACPGLDPLAAARWETRPQDFALAAPDALLRSAAPDEQASCLRELSQWGMAAGMDILLLSDAFPADAFPAEHPGPAAVELAPRLRLLPPLTPADVLSLVCACRCLLTDSDSLQREALYAGKRAIISHAAYTGQLASPLENGWHRVAPTCTAETLASLTHTLTSPCAHPGLPEGAGRALRRMLAAVMATLADRADGLI